MLANNFRYVTVEHISEFDESFTQRYNEENDEGYFFDVDIQYSENLHSLHNDLPFLPERTKIEKVEKQKMILEKILSS